MHAESRYQLEDISRALRVEADELRERTLARVRAAGRGQAVKAAAASGRDLIAAASQRARADQYLTLAGAGIGSEFDVSVRLSGPPETRARVQALSLRERGSPGGSGVPLLTLVDHPGHTVRLAATLPPDRFATPSTPWILEVLGRDGEITVVVSKRRVILRRWPTLRADGGCWPPRIELDSRGQLLLHGTRPDQETVAHDFRIGVHDMTLRWLDQDTGRSVLRLSRSDGRGTLTVDGVGQLGGTHTVEVDFRSLLPFGAGLWQLSVLARGDNWLALQHTLGEYPPLRKIAAPAGVPLTDPGAGWRQVSVSYTDDNRLTIALGPIASDVP